MDTRSSAPLCPDGPPAMSMSQRMGTIYPGHLGQRAGRPAQGRSQNTQQQTRQKRRTTDAGSRTTAPRKTSIPITTEPTSLLSRRPHGGLLLFSDLAGAKARGPWPFREGPTTSTHLDPSPHPPGAPRAIRRFNHRADENAHGTAQTHGAERLEEPWHAQPNAPRPRATGDATSG